MPRLSQTTLTKTPQLEFIFSVPLDMMNAMYFASLVPQMEGVDGWPERVRHETAPELLAELDFLYNYPAGDPGIMGIMGDNLFAQPEARRDMDSFLDHVRSLADGIGDLDSDPGIQGLIYETTFRHVDDWEKAPYLGLPHRDAIEQRMRALDDRDADAIMQLYDRPWELRERMVRLIEQFYREHYQHELPKRMHSLERSAAVHRGEPASDAIGISRRLTGRSTSCLEDVCQGTYDKIIFAPSLDMGPYNSCVRVGGVHGLIYACEPEFVGETPAAAEETQLARIYKALSDEQRLRILRMLREREMYAQEVVERTGLHQSVVSRHLMFMKAVGLLRVRRQNNMKFYSLNPDVRDELTQTVNLFAPILAR